MSIDEIARGMAIPEGSISIYEQPQRNRTGIPFEGIAWNRSTGVLTMQLNGGSVAFFPDGDNYQFIIWRPVGDDKGRIKLNIGLGQTAYLRYVHPTKSASWEIGSGLPIIVPNGKRPGQCRAPIVSISSKGDIQQNCTTSLKVVPIATGTFANMTFEPFMSI